jgi:hypothetical protein
MSRAGTSRSYECASVNVIVVSGHYRGHRGYKAMRFRFSPNAKVDYENAIRRSSQ